MPGNIERLPQIGRCACHPYGSEGRRDPNGAHSALSCCCLQTQRANSPLSALHQIVAGTDGNGLQRTDCGMQLLMLRFAFGADLEMLAQPMLLTLAERICKNSARKFQSPRVIVAAHSCSSAKAGFKAASPR